MKNRTIAFIFFFSIIFTGTAQTTLHEVTRDIVENLQQSSCTTPFWYDYAAHISNPDFYRAYCEDTSSALNWWNIYSEMTWSSYTPGLLLADTVLFDMAKNTIGNDTVINGSFEYGKIPLGLMDFDFNRIRPDAFDSVNKGVWYDWNNDSVWDVSGRPSSPFLTNPDDTTRGECLELFAFSPTKNAWKWRNVQFVFDPNKWVFYNSTFSANIGAHPNPHQFQIDFDDGAGWQDVDPFSYHEFIVTYPDSGMYYPKARVLKLVDGNPVEIKLSISQFQILSDKTVPIPHEVLNIGGADVGIYRGCKENVDSDTLLKPIIFVEGFDFFNNNHIPDIYDQYINDDNNFNKLPFLRNYAYDFVIVDWENSHKDMKDNAETLVEMLDYLKTRSDSSHQFVLMGHSMGGVIARYVLTYMETQAYLNSFSVQDSAKYKIHKRHNTRLFVSIDAPHQGAVVPLAFQHFYDWIYTLNPGMLKTAGILYQLLKGMEPTDLKTCWHKKLPNSY